jgi:Ca2+-binding EF-hand superfamily protein
VLPWHAICYAVGQKATSLTDFATTIIARLTSASTDRAAFSRQCVREFDRNEDGTVGAAEFQHVFAALQRIDEIAGGTSSSFVSAGCRPTLFGCTLFPTYSNAYAASAYQATAMLDRFDHDGDNVVTLDELAADPSPEAPETDAIETVEPNPTDGTTTPPPAQEVPPVAPSTPEERAAVLLAAYDTNSKGYITIEDVVNAWLKDPSLGDIANAGTAIEAWDTNGDGKVSHDDMVSAYRLMDAADTVLAALGDAATGRIALGAMSDVTLSQVELTRDQLAKWDRDSDGAVDRTELIDGLKLLQLAASAEAEQQAFEAMVTHFDANQDGAINADEFMKTMGSTVLDGTDQQATFAAWDSNGNGAIDATELQTGFNAIKDAEATIAAYDLAGKGYFDLADLQRVIEQNGQAEGQANASDIILAWDRDGDGKVSVQDVLTMKQAMVAVHQNAETPF